MSNMDIYLDNNATTQPTPAVRGACAEALELFPANPSSLHGLGVAVRRRVEDTRAQVTSFIGATFPSEIIFTSGATESIDTVFQTIRSSRGPGAAFIVSQVEHAAVLECADAMSQAKHVVHQIGVDSLGRLRMDELKEALSCRPDLVSLILANNETGVVIDIQSAVRLSKEAGALVHIDATQGMGRLKVNAQELGCDYLSFSAHKFHGPKGIGVLYVRSGAPRCALLLGRQEGGARGGTENVPGILGLGEAIRELQDGPSANDRIQVLRNHLESSLLAALPGVQVNGDTAHRVCNTTNLYFPSTNASDLVERLSRRGVHVSASAACSSGSEPSHVLMAMFGSRERANGSLRFSLSRLTTAEEIDAAITIVPDVLKHTLPVFEMANPTLDQ